MRSPSFLPAYIERLLAAIVGYCKRETGNQFKTISNQDNVSEWSLLLCVWCVPLQIGSASDSNYVSADVLLTWNVFFGIHKTATPIS
jgi:hypothetical protein